MPDLQSHIPQTIQDRFRDLLAPCRLFVRQDEQEIDIGFRRHQSASITAGRDDRHALGAGRNRRVIEMPRRGREQDSDDFVLHETQPFGAAAAMAIPQQQRLRGGARRDQFGFQQFCRSGAKNILATGVFCGERVNGGGDPLAIETVIGFSRMFGHDIVHVLSRYRTAL